MAKPTKLKLDDLGGFSRKKPAKGGAPKQASPADDTAVRVKAMSTRVTYDCLDQLHDIARQESTPDAKVTVQELTLEALNMLFKDRGMPPLAVPPPAGSAARRK